MISSRKPIHRGPAVGGDPVEVPLRFVASLVEDDDVESPLVAAAAEAQAIIAEAEVRRDQVLKDAWNEGYQAGHQEGVTQVNGALSVADHMVHAMADQIAQMPDRLAPQVTAMALEVAARIVRAELSVRPERVADIVRGAIRRATDRERLMIHVNPSDVAIVREAAPEFGTQIGGITRVEVVDDPRIPAGGCIVETPSGDIDARLATQFERLAQALADVPDEELVDDGDAPVAAEAA